MDLFNDKGFDLLPKTPVSKIIESTATGANSHNAPVSAVGPGAEAVANNSGISNKIVRYFLISLFVLAIGYTIHVAIKDADFEKNKED